MTKNERIKSFLSTLPINIYTREDKKYRLLFNDSSQVFINFVHNTINFGLGVFKDIEDPSENMMRSIFYHEVSHAILSDLSVCKPSAYSKEDFKKFNPNLKDFSITNAELNSVLNLIEDERIETILHDYYHDVDFRSLITALSKFTDNSPLSHFANTVRLRITPESYEVDKLLKPLLKVNVTKEDYFPLINLYLEMKENSEEEYSQDNGKGTGEESDKDSNTDEREKGSGDKKEQRKEESEENEKTDKEFTRDEQEVIIKESIKNKRAGDQKKEQVNKLKESVARDFNIEQIIRKIVLKAKTSSYHKTKSIKNGYDIEAVDIYAFQDLAKNRYQIFKNKGREKDDNKIFVLNLIIDTSYSFVGNEDKVNSLLATLEKLEKKFDKFRFTLTTISYGHEELVSGSRRIQCDGGTSISPRLREIYKSINVPNSYSIFLLDGFTHLTDSNLDYLDTPNMFICVDTSNECYFYNFRKAKVQYVVNNSAYIHELEDFIKRTLSVIARKI